MSRDARRAGRRASRWAREVDAGRDIRLRRNVRLYPWYAGFVNALFWMPIFFLFFSEHLTLERVLWLEAIYYAAVVLLEVPSGYFSDAVGRRVTLIISSLALLGAYLLFFIGADVGNFGTFATAQVLLAAGFAFNSGTDASFHYDSLAALGESDRYAGREALAARNMFLASALAAAGGGAVAVLGLRWAYLLSAGSVAVALVMAVAFIEPTVKSERSPMGWRFVAHLGQCAGYLRVRVLRWLFGYAVFMVMLNHVPYEFYQPYIDLALGEGDGEVLGGLTPAAAGLHMAVTMWIGSLFAARSVTLRDRLGLTAALLAAAALQAVIIGAMGVVLSAWLLPLILLRTVPRALMTAPLNAAIAPRVLAGHRATYLSMQNLSGRLAFSVLLAGLSLGVGEAMTWESLAWMLRVCGGVAVGGVILLVVTGKGEVGEGGSEG